MSKADIRKLMKLQKRELKEEYITENSKRIAQLLINTPEYKNAEDIYIYVSYNQEVVTYNIINRAITDRKNVYVPKIIDKKMHFIHIRGLEDLAPGSFGILEPISNIVDTKNSGVLIMPLLAFDKDFNRLGYGGGYYDRYLEEHTNNITIGLAYDFQKVEKLEVESFDIPLQMVITPSGVFKNN